MPTATSLTIRLHNPERLRDQLEQLKSFRAEIQSVNLNNTPLQWHTKLRWEEQLARVVDFFQQFIPPDLPGGA